MKEFVMIYRNDTANEMKISPDAVPAILKDWENWIGGIAAQGKLVNVGARLGVEGKTVKPGNVITTGPYVELNEILRGLTIISAASLEEASETAKGCPILKVGGSVEVRDVIPMNN